VCAGARGGVIERDGMIHGEGVQFSVPIMCVCVCVCLCACVWVRVWGHLER